MRCTRRYGRVSRLLFFFALVLADPIAAAQGTSAPNTPPQWSEQTSEAMTQRELWIQLSSEWTALGDDISKLEQACAELGIDINVLPSYLTDMRTRLASLTESITAYDVSLKAAERSRNAWRAATVVVTVAAAGLTLALVLK